MTQDLSSPLAPHPDGLRAALEAIRDLSIVAPHYLPDCSWCRVGSIAQKALATPTPPASGGSEGLALAPDDMRYKYSLAEIDEMRVLVGQLWALGKGSAYGPIMYSPRERVNDVEALLRTYMFNGTCAAELRNKIKEWK